MKNKLLSSKSWNNDLAALFVRLILGGLFIYHGWQKIDDYDKIAPMFKGYLGMGPNLSFNMVIFAEFFCGILVVIGLFTRLAVIPIIITMMVVVFIVSKGSPFQKKELAVLFLALCLPVFFMGGGKYSVDRIIFKK
jgi:putative oxidoreductase